MFLWGLAPRVPGKQGLHVPCFVEQVTDRDEQLNRNKVCMLTRFTDMRHHNVEQLTHRAEELKLKETPGLHVLCFVSICMCLLVEHANLVLVQSVVQSN